MATPNFTEEIELSLRAFTREKAETALPDVHVFDTPFYFASAQDFAATVEEEYVQDVYKVRYLMITFAGFVDSRTRGCDDNPSTYPSYNLQLFRETSEARDGQLNSHDLLVKDMTILRNTFLRDRDVILNKIVHEALVMQGVASYVSFSDYVLETVGDTMNFRLTFEVN